MLGRVSVGAVPRGVALEHADDGKPTRAWVYNAVANTVSLIDLSDTTSPRIAGFVKLEDPTHRQVKLGRTWFNDADASSTDTFSCESCHPDSNTDQLLWVLATPVVSRGDQIMPRSTMPVRGLRDTAPFHWDGVLGDPYGGNNSANIFTSVEPNSDIDDQSTSTRHLVDASLGGVLNAHGDDLVNDEGKPGAFTAAERDDLAMYLLSVMFPPAQRRAYDNVLSETAKQGYRLFHTDGDLDPSKTTPNVCGNCHRMPFLVSTNTPGTGMDAPTWRGAYDRFLILPQGRLNIIEFPFYRNVAERGNSEEEIWRFSWGGRRRFNPIWNMVLEGSTGFSGAFSRQVTLNSASVSQDLTRNLMDALEISADEGAVVLEAEGVLINDSTSRAVELQFDPAFQGGVYVSKARDREAFPRARLMELAADGRFVGTFTGRHGENADVDNPQPALWTLGTIHEQRGRQTFPVVYEGKSRMALSGRNFDDNANIYVDGRRVHGSIEVIDDEQEQVLIELASLPELGMHMLQVQAENGHFSNDFIIHVTESAEAAAEMKRRHDEAHVDVRDALANAIAEGNVEEVKKRLGRQAHRINDRRPSTGSTPLSDAAFRGNLEIVKLLIDRRANVNATNRDGNTALISAAFMCRTEVVRLLLDKGAETSPRNNRGQTVIEILSQPWNKELASFYTGIADLTGLKVDLDRLKQERPKIAEMLRRHALQ